MSRRLALVAAALLLFAQTVAAAHYHPRLNGSASESHRGGFSRKRPCALCLLAFHFPGTAPSAPATMEPHCAFNPTLALSPGRAFAVGRSPAQTRAPPFITL